MYGYQSSYPEDIKTVQKVEKYREEFDKFDPHKFPLTLEEAEDDTEDRTGLNEPTPAREIAYYKKVEAFQQNPIELTDSAKGMEDILREIC